jgi:cytochrome c oxidase cbb3-type subunit 2
MFNHGMLERHSMLLIVCILIVVSIGGIVEIAPLFYLESTIEKVQGMRPYTPLELKGREIYIREGCYLCHSQMIRPLRDEVERYGHYSLAAESMYDHPFQWGSKRTGPDLARVGAKYSDEWHRAHLADPRSVVPESVMPPYIFLEKTALRFDDIEDTLKASSMVGVPYSEDMVKNAKADLIAQATPDADGLDAFQGRYKKAVARDFDHRDGRVDCLPANAWHARRFQNLSG